MKRSRMSQILELVSRQGQMEVAVLARQLGVSQVTVRKDLDLLEQRGLLRREHGVAVAGSRDDMNNRLAVHYEQKRRIARRAVQLVSPGETVMIENGSCCALLAEEIARNKPGASIITNSAFIASYIRRLGAQVVLLGGDFQNDAQVMVGPLLRVCAEQFYVERLFVGADGWSESLGFTADNHLRVQAVRDMAARAGQVIVITESEKFSLRSLTPLEVPVAAVVTDGGLAAETASALAASGIQVYQADDGSCSDTFL